MDDAERIRELSLRLADVHAILVDSDLADEDETGLLGAIDYALRGEPDADRVKWQQTRESALDAYAEYLGLDHGS